MKNLAITTLISAVFGCSIFLTLREIDDSSVFFAIISIVSILLAALASPSKNILRGLRRLWLFDWILSLGLPIAVSFIGPINSIEAVVAHYLSFALFFLSGAVLSRRGKTGRAEKLN